MSCYDPSKPNQGQRINNIWINMKQRCYNPNVENYSRYGGRGISVCKEWRDSFLKFVEWSDNNGYKDNLTLDREDNEGDYCPSNCKWSTQKEQQLNRKNSKVWIVEGIEYESLKLASKDLRVSENTIKRWCEGRLDKNKNGTAYNYPRKENCYSKLKYPKVGEKE